MRKENILDDFLVKLAQNTGRQAWAGQRMPFAMEPIDFVNSTNYRVSNSLHQKFNVVWLFEVTVNDFKGFSWKIVLDEAIRLLGEDGYIVIRMHNTDTVSIPMVKAFFGRHIGLSCDVAYETAPDQMEDIVVLAIHRENFKQYSASLWTFGILTVGNQVGRVCKFLQSVRQNDNAYKHEIIIVGPKNQEYEKYDVRYIAPCQISSDKYAEVSKKKNAIIEHASRPNLMIIHDRYVLGHDFFSGFDEYGYDFDFLTIKQYDLEGREFPSYSATKKKMCFAGQVQVNDYSRLYETQYLNGGLVIFKTETARKIRFNNVLFWNQMEDVELAKVAMDNSIVPRINYLSSAKTLVVKSGYLTRWHVDEGNKYGDIQCIDGQFTSIKSSLIKYAVTHIPMRYKSTCLYRFLKRHVKH